MLNSHRSQLQASTLLRCTICSLVPIAGCSLHDLFGMDGLEIATRADHASRADRDRHQPVADQDVRIAAYPAVSVAADAQTMRSESVHRIMPDGSQSASGYPGTTSVQANTAVDICADDPYGDNHRPTDAARITYEEASGGIWGHAYAVVDDAFLCSGQDDWFFLSTTTLPFEATVLHLRASARGAGMCRGHCGDAILPRAEHNTLTVEFYAANGANAPIHSLGGATRADGVVWLDMYAPALSKDLLIRITGPEAATYPYYVTIWLSNEDGEDECEC